MLPRRRTDACASCLALIKLRESEFIKFVPFTTLHTARALCSSVCCVVHPSVALSLSLSLFLQPVNADRSKAHAVACTVGAEETIAHECVGRGGVTIHNEYIVHGSGGNDTQGWRRTYVAAFRTLDTIKQERAAGFTHSHNDAVNWDTFNKWQESQ